MVPKKATIQIKNYEAVSYVDAMHRLCIDCHVKEAVTQKNPKMTQCEFCHKDNLNAIYARDLSLRYQPVGSSSPVLPPITH